MRCASAGSKAAFATALPSLRTRLGRTIRCSSSSPSTAVVSSPPTTSGKFSLSLSFSPIRAWFWKKIWWLWEVRVSHWKMERENLHNGDCYVPGLHMNRYCVHQCSLINSLLRCLTSSWCFSWHEKAKTIVVVIVFLELRCIKLEGVLEVPEWKSAGILLEFEIELKAK